MFARGFENAPQDLGEPTRLSSVPLYGALADVAQDAGIVVLQVGEGADELFMGYSSYRTLDTSQPDFHFNFMLPENRQPYLDALYGGGAVANCRRIYDEVYPINNGISGLEHLRRIELDHSLEPLLRRADQILMSRSIEGRTPFLHGDVPQLAMRLDAEHHMTGPQSKPMLRAAFPELNRLDGPWRTKTPFRAPVSRWLQTSLRPWMDQVLDDGTEVLRTFGLRETGIALIRQDAAAGKAAALDMALALMSLVFWSNGLRQERHCDQ
jgi:asparagine synthase (glutamine-hydrolysing)